MASSEIRSIAVGAPPINLSVTVAGEGPTVVLLHGFPEIGYSWRHQIHALADAGYQVIAPDQRGYGWSDAPAKVIDYDIFRLAGDVIGLLDHFEVDQATLVGHDWGSIIAWNTALFRPDRFNGLMLMSVPYQPRGEMSFDDRIREADPEGPFGYMVAFQDQDNPVEALLDADPISSIRSVMWSASAHEPDPDDPNALPPFMTADEFENYCRAFARSGFGGPINYYRNLGRNWELLRPWHEAKVQVPTRFLGGREDFVVEAADQGMSGRSDSHADRFVDYRGEKIIEGAGHWVQQEKPDEVTADLLEFLVTLD